MANEKLIEDYFRRGILVNKELLDKEVDEKTFEKIKTEQDLIVLNSDYVDVISQQSSLVDWYEVDNLRVDAEKKSNDELYQSHLQDLATSAISSPMQQSQVSSLETTIEGGEVNFSTTAEVSEEMPVEIPKDEHEVVGVEVVINYKNIPKKYVVNSFAHIFSSRYRFLESLLRSRQELQRTVTVNRLQGKTDREQASIIGVVQDIALSKNNNLLLKIEDPTGIMSVVVTQNKKELFTAARDLVFDEVVGVSGISQGTVMFADQIIWPDLPDTRTLKKSDVEEYAIFLSDIHVGSKLFLEKEFMKLMTWLQGKVGSEEQKAIANKVKYVIIPGDLIDGIGIYPLQEQELAITDIKKQYDEFTRYLKMIPQDKQIICCPGNHDVVHLAEPQPQFYPEYTQELYDMPNVTLVSNPAMVNIAKTDSFEGFNVLLYHGYSFDYYIANVESIRLAGGYHRSDLIMKFLLKRRHLAPSFASTPYFPGHDEDPLLIKQIPDFLASGHIHYCSVANYKSVTMICGSCWQGTTDFQEKLGHKPEPARVPIVNLKTREVKVLRFN